MDRSFVGQQTSSAMPRKNCHLHQASLRRYPEIKLMRQAMALRWPLVCFALALGLGISQLLAQNLNADSELSLGIEAYKKAKYNEAIDHLERHVTLRPESM